MSNATFPPEQRSPETKSKPFGRIGRKAVTFSQGQARATKPPPGGRRLLPTGCAWRQEPERRTKYSKRKVPGAWNRARLQAICSYNGQEPQITVPAKEVRKEKRSPPPLLPA